jgi:hypothetical protein
MNIKNSLIILAIVVLTAIAVFYLLNNCVNVGETITQKAINSALNQGA